MLVTTPQPIHLPQRLVVAAATATAIVAVAVSGVATTGTSDPGVPVVVPAERPAAVWQGPDPVHAKHLQRGTVAAPAATPDPLLSKTLLRP